MNLPGSFNLERTKPFSFRVGELLFKNGVDPATARAFVERCAKIGKAVRRTGGYDLHVPIFCVSDPTPQGEFCRFAMNEPAEAYPLNSAFYKVVTNHSNNVSVADAE